MSTPCTHLISSPLISSCQSAFLQNKQIFDGVVVVNEIVDYAKNWGKDIMILKVDFEKAYDFVNLSFLDYMMGQLVGV